MVFLWLAICAAGAVASTLYTGRNNASVLLVSLFVTWVATPFAFLAVRLLRGNATAALPIAFGSLAIYIIAIIGPAPVHGAFLYLATPVLAWLAIGSVVLTQRRTRR